MAFNTLALLWLLPFGLAYMKKNDAIPDKLPEEAFFRYVSRPDILVPRWNVTVNNRAALSPGYWFTAFYEDLVSSDTGKPYVGPQIYDDDGELVWSSTDMFHHAVTNDFRVARYRGEDVITLQSWYGKPKFAHILNNHYEMVKMENAAKYGEAANMHDFNLVEDGRSALFLHSSVRLAPLKMSKAVGFTKGQCRIESATFEERDTSNNTDWKQTFHWDPLDHLSIEESSKLRVVDINDQCEHRWDWLHANSIEKCPDGNYLMSARNMDAIYKISRATGEILWRMGGPKSDLEMDFNFSKQHHARCHIANETHTVVSLLDNAGGDGAGAHSNPWSRGLLMAIDETTKRAEILSQYPHPLQKVQGARGSFHLLDNGHVFMGWSARSLVSEHAADGEVLMYAHILAGWMRAYRSYKYKWVGLPRTPPDVVARAKLNRKADSSQSTVTQVHMSWNGATEVRSWNVYRSDRVGNTTELVASVPRRGFETEITYDGLASHVIVEALNAEGKVLDFGRTDVIRTNMLNDTSSVIMKTAQIDDSRWSHNLEFQTEHPWLAEVHAVYATPWGMFAAGALAMAGTMFGLWLIVLCLPRKKSWRLQRNHHCDDDPEDDEKCQFLYSEDRRDDYKKQSSNYT